MKETTAKSKTKSPAPRIEFSETFIVKYKRHCSRILQIFYFCWTKLGRKNPQYGRNISKPFDIS